MEKKSLNRILVIITGIMVLSALVVTAYAAVPKTINYQGYLTDSGGIPVTGSASIEFSLYTAPTGTASNVWTEGQSVTVNNGVFNAVIGTVESVTFSSLPFDVPYYIGVKVGADAEMTPRQAVSSSAYAITADTAFKLSCTGCVTNGMIADSTISDAKLAPSGTVVTNLNADMVDGSHASAFAASSHGHAGTDITSGTVADARLSSNVATLSGTQTISGSKTFLSQIASSVGTGTAPLSVSSTTKVTNLNADSLDGNDSTAFAAASHTQDVSTVTNAVSTNGAQTISGSKTFSSRIISSATGTAPFSIASTSVVTNLNSDLLDGYNAGNASGNIPLSNGTVNANLNADLLDGMNTATAGTASTIAARDASGNITANAFSYSSAKTYYYSLNPGEYHANDAGDDTWYYSWPYGYFTACTGSCYGYPMTGVHLPDGATLTGMDCSYYDADATYNVTMSAYIIRKTYNSSSGSTVLSASATSSGSAGWASVSATATSHTIDNYNYQYIAGVDWSPGVAGSTLRFGGCRLTYTMSAPH